MKAWQLRLALNLYPPFLGAGVRVTRIDPDFRAIDVRVPLRWYNRNYYGTQFGGTLFSMTDPFFALMYIQNLGADFRVWDKAATIAFQRQGRGAVRAEFRLSEADIAKAREIAASGTDYEPRHRVTVFDGERQIVAEIEKTVHIRYRPS